MNKISGLIYSLRIHFEDEEMPEGFYESLDMIDFENKHQQAEIKRLRKAKDNLVFNYQSENKKLRDALEALLPHIDDAYWPNKIDKAEKALKESE